MYEVTYVFDSGKEIKRTFVSKEIAQWEVECAVGFEGPQGTVVKVFSKKVKKVKTNG